MYKRQPPITHCASQSLPRPTNPKSAPPIALCTYPSLLRPTHPTSAPPITHCAFPSLLHPNQRTRAPRSAHYTHRSDPLPIHHDRAPNIYLSYPHYPAHHDHPYTYPSPPRLLRAQRDHLQASTCQGVALMLQSCLHMVP